MKRALSYLFSMALMVAFIAPAAAQGDSTPDASTPQASPSAMPLQAGVTEYINEDGHELSIDLTALEGDVDGIELTESFDPEADSAGDEAFVFEEEHDAPDDCRLIEYSYDGDADFDAIFIGICADEDFGLWIVGTEKEALEHVSEQFAAGETDLVPEGYEEFED